MLGGPTYPGGRKRQARLITKGSSVARRSAAISERASQAKEATRTAGTQPGLGRGAGTGSSPSVGEKATHRRQPAARATRTRLRQRSHARGLRASTTATLQHIPPQFCRSSFGAGEAEPADTAAARQRGSDGAWKRSVTRQREPRPPSSACGRRNCGRDGECSPTAPVALCLSRTEAACLVPHVLNESCSRNPPAAGKPISPPLTHTFLSLPLAARAEPNSQAGTSRWLALGLGECCRCFSKRPPASVTTLLSQPLQKTAN